MRAATIASVLAGFWASLAALAQGTVNFANGPGGIDARILTPGGLASGSAYKADLWYGPAGIAPNDLWNSGLQSLGLAVDFATGASAGYFFGGAQAIPGNLPGSVVSLQVRAWRASDGATFADALAALVSQVGLSYVIQSQPLGGGIIPIPDMIWLEGFCVRAAPEDPCIPEPSTLGLVILGATALMLHCRRRLKSSSSSNSHQILP